MSNLVFPSLPGCDIKVDREVEWSTTVHTSSSGKEQRASWESSPRYRYTLSFNVLRTDVNAPAPLNAYSETEVVLKFLNDHKGSFDSFLFNDPYDGVQRRVRLVDDSLILERLADGLYHIQKLALLSLK